jgi:plasmid stabilization system protein ParE
VAKPRLSSAAIEDIRSIRAYTKRKFGAGAVASYLSDINAAVSLNGDRPTPGRGERTLEPDLRSFPCRFHRIYYRGAPGAVEVSRILHQAQDVAGQFDQ